MPWEIRGGKTVRVSDDIQVNIEIEVDTDELVCSECGKVYKTVTGLVNHQTDKH